jgi:menaquinone-dependent protoporphyrinogen oxidase
MPVPRPRHVPVLFASHETRTARVAEHVAEMLRDSGCDSHAVDLASRGGRTLDWQVVDALVLGTALRAGQPEGQALRFARQHVDLLNSCPSAFFVVSLGPHPADPASAEAATRDARAFVDAVRWHPTRLGCFTAHLPSAGAGWFSRLFGWTASRQDRRQGPEYGFTDWAAVSRFARDFAVELQAPAAGR